MASAQDLIRAAEREVGYVERPTNRTKYGAWYGLDGQPYCAMFLSWLHAQTNSLEMCNFSTAKGYAYTPSGAAGFQKRGQWGRDPRPGAHVFFKFSGNRIHHVGLVVASGPGWIETIEGNTSRGSGGSQRDGGGVWRRRRSSGIVGYGYPAYDAGGAPPPPTPPAPGDDRQRPYPGYKGRYGGYNMKEFQGRRDGNVEWIQARLNGTNLEPKLKQDGDFGPATDKAVRGFQGAVGLRQDGIVGAQTWERLKGR